MPPSTPGKPLIEVRNLVKVYRTPAGDLPAVKGVDVAVRHGEFVAVIGKSGSGKSTFINLLTGIDRPTSGEIVIGGEPIHTYDEGRLAKWRGRSLGIVFQFFQLIPTLTAVENVILPMELNRLYDDRWRYKRALHLLKKVELEDQADKLPAELSGGQQQRVAIARALATDPMLIVADEPTGNLDPASAERIFALFETLVADGKTVLMVTHDADLARRVDRTILISNGEIVNEYLVRALAALTQDQLTEVARRVQPQVYPRDASIIRQGEIGDQFFILLEGKADVLVDAPGGGLVLVNRLGPGNYFGEMALLGNGIRAATVKASDGDVKVAALDNAAFNDLINVSPALRQELMEIVEQRRRAAQIQELSASQIVPASELTVMASGQKRRVFQAGHEIIRQGELGDSFFIIEYGTVDVFIRGSDGADTLITQLGGGRYFGETVVLGDRRRGTSVRVSADGPAHCIEYGADEFEQLIAGTREH
ncbi:MAG TPA: ATP-binding cassette domain-containing protein [Anaerolineales bacterium]|jgi:ABC-type lipoprotein export system ATPase subunit